jgi:hypothetical protein
MGKAVDPFGVGLAFGFEYFKGIVFQQHIVLFFVLIKR